MAIIRDEAGNPILDEAGAPIADEAGVSGNPSVSTVDLTLAINQATVNTGSAGLGIVNAISLALSVNMVAGFGTVVEVNTIGLTFSLKQLAGAIPPGASDWLKDRLDDWIIDFAA